MREAARVILPRPGGPRMQAVVQAALAELAHAVSVGTILLAGGAGGRRCPDCKPVLSCPQLACPAASCPAAACPAQLPCSCPPCEGSVGPLLVVAVIAAFAAGVVLTLSCTGRAAGRPQERRQLQRAVGDVPLRGIWGQH